MAEANVETPLEVTRYFCHQCNTEVQPVMPDFVCSRCQSGFIEELENQQREQQQAAADAGRILFGNFLRGFGDTNNRESVDEPNDDWDDQRESRRRRNHGGASNSRIVMHPMTGGTGNPSMDAFVHQLFSNLGITVVHNSGGEGIEGPMRSSFSVGNGIGNGILGDYAIGANGLDNIITQLLNQLDNTGPPPADKVKITNLPLTTVTENMIDGIDECAVCKDDYTLGEQVKQLPCKHVFHPVCVDPWLELHDSCPICRCNLNGEQSNQST